MTTIEGPRPITGGVDTHGDLHVVAALDALGAVLGTESFAATRAGYAELCAWLSALGPIEQVGVEGTGAYGAGLARFLSGRGLVVVEVSRPDRQARRRQGKSDTLDAVEAARAAQAGRGVGAKTKGGSVEAMRMVLVARRSAMYARTKALVQARHLVYTGPDELRERLRGCNVSRFVEQTARLRPQQSPDQLTAAAKVALSSLARRARALETEIAAHDRLLESMVRSTAPQLLALRGVGPVTAATLLVAAGDNPGRLRSEAAWAHLCGVAPIPASSGKVTRHRLDRGGDRQANSALWRIVMVRLSCDPDTKAYMERRNKEGRSPRETVRSLKRYVAREVYRYLPRG